MSQSREQGSYYVTLNGNEIIATYDKDYNCWYIPGREEMFYDSDFSYISPSPITRESKGELPTEEEFINSFKIVLSKIDKNYLGAIDQEAMAAGELYSWIKNKINHGKE